MDSKICPLNIEAWIHKDKETKRKLNMYITEFIEGYFTLISLGNYYYYYYYHHHLFLFLFLFLFSFAFLQPSPRQG